MAPSGQFTHLMRLAGRFARRVRAYAAANGISVIDCVRGVRKHLIAGEYLRTHSVGPGVFLILVARAPATVWDVRRSADGRVIGNIAKKISHVNHYSCHIMDPRWGHLTVKMSGHPPFGAQVILNGHEYVAAAAQAAGIGFAKEGNCLLVSRIRGAWRRSQIPCRRMRLQGGWARSVTGGSIRRACASAWIWPSRRAAGSVTPTRPARPNTPGT